MSTVDDTLAALKTTIATIDISPAPTGVWNWKRDYDEIQWDDYAFIVIEQAINRWFGFRPVSQGVGWHQWVASIAICLAAGPLTRDEAFAKAQIDVTPWLLALATTLFANRSLGGTVFDLSAPTDRTQLFAYRIGNMGWFPKVPWGIHCEIMVTQDHSLPG